MDTKNPRGKAANDAQTVHFLDGQDAGTLLLSPALNPHPEGSAANELWRQGHGRGTDRTLFGRKAGR